MEPYTCSSDFKTVNLIEQVFLCQNSSKNLRVSGYQLSVLKYLGVPENLTLHCLRINGVKQINFSPMTSQVISIKIKCSKC